MASNLSSEQLEQATLSQARGWQELLDRLLGSPEYRRDERPVATIRRAPRVPKAP